MKKRLLKILSVILVVAICFGSFSCAYGAFFIRKKTAEASILQEGSFDQPSEQRDYYKSSRFATFLSEGNDETAIEYIYHQLYNYKESFNVYEYKINTDDFLDIYSQVINNNPDLFFVSGTFSYNYVTTDNCVYEVTPFYTMEQSEAEEAKTIFENGAQKALSKLDSSMNDVQKCLVLHDYICDAATYPDVFDDDGNVIDDNEIYHTAYGFFSDGNVVCAGYTLAYSYLLNRIGIETTYVTSEIMTHAWNKVKINGNWYNIDLTFDDLSYGGNGTNTFGDMEHVFFMKSDEYFAGEAGHFHFGGYTSIYAPSNDTSYDNYFWNDIDTFIPVVNGDYYYLNPVQNQYLYKRTVDGKVTLVGSDSFKSQRVKFTGTSYEFFPVEENGETVIYVTPHEFEHVDYMNRLVYLDNRFYIASEKSIYSYAYINGKYEKTAIQSNLNNYIDGMSACDNEIVFQLYNDSIFNDNNATHRLDKMDYFKKHIKTSNINKYFIYVDINLDGVINAKDYAIIKKQVS